MRKSPFTPLRVKAKGKENRRDVLKPRLSRARGRVTRLTREVDAALDEAIAAFNGTARDRQIWARIAWRIGAENFHHLVIEKISENSNDGLPDSLAATFQAFIDKRYPKPAVDATARRVVGDAVSHRVEIRTDHSSSRRVWDKRVHEGGLK